MTSWSDGPFDRVERLTDLELGKSLSENNGQSRRVCVVGTHPGWLFKEYRADVSPADEAQLDRLIEQPTTLRPADRELINRNTSWPVARVITDSRTIGVILPEAPSSFSTELRTINGRTRTTMLPIDLLAIGDERMSQLGLPRLSLNDRVTVCSSIAAVSALFERHGLVYLDWSYANAFWSTSELAAYVIDVDGCSFGPRLQTETTGWADPLVPLKTMANNEVDRYRVALLVARCLTAERDIGAVLAAAESLARSAPSIRGVADHVVRALTVTPAAARPSLVELSAALTDAVTGIPQQRSAQRGLAQRGLAQPGSSQQGRVQPGSGVKGWTPVKRRPGHPPTGPIPRPQPVDPSRPVPVPGLERGPTIRPTPVPPTPVPAAEDTDTATVLLGLLLLAGLLFLIIVVLR